MRVALVVSVLVACSSQKPAGNSVACGPGTVLVGSVCEVPDAGPGDAAVDAALDAPPDATVYGTAATSIGIDPAHDNVQPTDVVASPLTPLWMTTFNGRVSYPLVARDTVFVAAAESPPNVRGLDIKTGATVWGPITMPGRVTLAYDDGRVFAVEQLGHIIALDAATGSQVWSTQIQSLFFDAPPVAAGGVLYVSGASTGGVLIALDEQTGTSLWTSEIGGTDGAVAVSGGVVYVDEACDLSALDAVTGALAWARNYQCSGGGGAAPSIYATKIWYRNPSLGNVVLDHGGTLLGTFPAFGIPAFHNGIAFYQTLDDVTAVDIATSTLKWRFTGDGELCTSPVVAGAAGQVFIGSCNGKVYELDELTGSQRSVHDIGTAITRVDETNAISLADGHLLVPAGNTLVVY